MAAPLVEKSPVVVGPREYAKRVGPSQAADEMRLFCIIMRPAGKKGITV